MQRVIVIGCPGCGKSTFARALQGLTGLPLHYLDMLHWNPDRTTVDRDVFRSRLADVLAQDRWIIDGNYASTMAWRMQRCDTVFFLDYPLETCLAGIESRQGQPRPDMPWIEDGTDEEFLDFIRAYPESSRPQVLALLAEQTGKDVHIFHTREEAQAFLSHLTAGYMPEKYPWIDAHLMVKPGVTRDLKAEWNWVRYMVGGKLFAAICLDRDGKPYYITLKLPPDEGEFLRKQYADIMPGYYCNKVHWSSVRPEGDVPADLLQGMLDKSYGLVLSGLTKKLQRQILAAAEQEGPHGQ